jgi:peptidoglycan/LPS O-acetylase OafA/YrhL
VPAIIAATGLGGLLLTAAYIPSYAYGASGLAAITTVVIILDIVRPGSSLARLLEAQWLVWVGRISYGLYLWHFPMFSQFGVLKPPGEMAPPVQGLLAWSATFGAAFASPRMS